MRDHGKEGAIPRDEFKALLASGALSPAMRQFLTSTLGQPSLIIMLIMTYLVERVHDPAGCTQKQCTILTKATLC